MSKTGRLAALTVLVTRPRHQADDFCRLIESEGARALRFPVIEIAVVENQTAVKQQVSVLPVCDFLVFISPNAVVNGLPLIRPLLGAQTNIVAIGGKTAKTLEQHHLQVAVLPQAGADSEALLEHPMLQELSGKHVVIVRGGVGRDLLETAFRKRGAKLTVLDVYSRRIPHQFPALAPMLERTDVIAITSNQGLQNLYTMADSQARELLLHTPLLAGSERVLELASELGFTATHIKAKSPADDAMLEALLMWVQSGEHSSVRP